MAQRLSARDSKWNPPPVVIPELPAWDTLLTLLTAHAFDQLRVAISFWNTKKYWHPIHTPPGAMEFEIEHGVEARRWPYNERCFAEVLRSGKLVVGEHAGFYDLFVPVRDRGGIKGLLVAGPMSRARPTAAELRERWYWLTGSQGRLSDPGFSQYLSTTLATLTLEGSLFETFERLLGCFADLIGGNGAALSLAAEADALRIKLLEARSAETMWDAVGSMVNERTTRSWAAPDQARTLVGLGLKRAPAHAIVGLLVSAASDPDPVDDVLRRHEFQRACTRLARKVGGIVCGQVGDQGIALLTDDSGPTTRIRGRLTEIAQRASASARRLGFKLHVGVSQAKGEESLPARYLAAMETAEMALSRGVALIYGESRPEHSAKRLRKLRRQLSDSVGEEHTLLSARFENYAQTVLEHCAYRLEPVRARLEAGLERLAEPLLATGALDEKSFDELWDATERSSADLRTATALALRYRQLVSDIEAAMQSPVRARQGRGTARALSFMREHLGEPLTREDVARAAGFAPDYFSKLFKKSEGVTFERYLQRLRLERAKEMLTGTSLSVEGVNEFCGFNNRIYFHRLFRRTV
ncbi:MAG TPA: AraC family transcriptional regulator, partial [Polyangiaceae bacterium]|nr:AraC family transcriptional regulator [Polyangiaceae bacterium]